MSLQDTNKKNRQAQDTASRLLLCRYPSRVLACARSLLQLFTSQQNGSLAGNTNTCMSFFQQPPTYCTWKGMASTPFTESPEKNTNNVRAWHFFQMPSSWVSQETQEAILTAFTSYASHAVVNTPNLVVRGGNVAFSVLQQNRAAREMGAFSHSDFTVSGSPLAF